MKPLFKKLSLALFIALSLVTLVLISRPKYALPGQKTPTATLATQTINLQIADTPLLQAKGLMGVTHLEKNDGMLFIFNRIDFHAFWMKNTLIPLDMLWLDENLKIVDIKENVQPCKETVCDSYMPAQPAEYVLELNGGWCKENNVKIEDTITLSLQR